MTNSKVATIILAIIIVIVSYVFYNPTVDISSLNISEKLKNIVANLVQFDKLKDEKNNGLNSLITDTLFTVSELNQFTGNDNDKIYLSILGKVFDVSEGKKYYGVGQNYHGFAGRDASKAFVTGDFTEQGLVDDITDLSDNELGDLQEWVNKYEKDYIYKGKLIGRFYGETGKPTNVLKEIEQKLSRLSDNKKMEEFYKKNYPPCNVEWSPETGSRVWCSRFSGGVKRNWIGFPRKFLQPGTIISRCACVNLKDEDTNQGNIEVYHNCDSKATSCNIVVHR